MNSNTYNIKEFVQRRGRLLGQIIAGILVVISLLLIAKMVWMWVEFAQPQTELVEAKPSKNTRSANKRIDINKLVNLHVFGEANASQEEVVTANETSLNLKLMGVYVAAKEDLSSAIIQTNGSKQKTYALKEKIQAGRNVTLQKVLNEHVIINNNGKVEKLTLIENLNQAILESKSAPKEVRGSARKIDKRKDSRLSSDLKEIQDKLAKNPQSLAGLASFEPVMGEDGQISGLKIGPGKDPRLFTRLGLRRNDVIKTINGQGAQDGLASVMQELQQAKSLELSLERNGSPVTLLLNLGASQPTENPTRAKPTLERIEPNSSTKQKLELK